MPCATAATPPVGGFTICVSSVLWAWMNCAQQHVQNSMHNLKRILQSCCSCCAVLGCGTGFTCSEVGQWQQTSSEWLHCHCPISEYVKPLSYPMNAQLQQDWDRSAIHLSSAVQVMIKCAQCCVQSVMLSVDLLHESQSSKCKPSTNDRWAVYSTKSNCITSVVEYIAFPACLLSSDQNSPIFFLSTGLKETCSSTYLLYTVVSLLNSEIHIHLWKN